MITSPDLQVNIFQVHCGFPVVRDYWSGKRRDPIATVNSVKSIVESSWFLKGGPEPADKEIHEILGSKREDRFSDPFFDSVQNKSLGHFSYLLWLCNFCKAPLDMRKFSQKCQKIAGCWECTVYGSRPPIASTPGSSSPEWPGLDNITSQPWSDATSPYTSSVSAYLRFVTIFLLRQDKVIEAVVRGQVASDHGWLLILSRPVRSRGDKPGFEAIRGREH